MQVIEWKCEPYAQPVMALNTLKREPIVRYDWTLRELKDMTRWTNRWLWRNHSFSEYKAYYKRSKNEQTDEV
jgi:hypothetical protein